MQILYRQEGELKEDIRTETCFIGAGTHVTVEQVLTAERDVAILILSEDCSILLTHITDISSIIN